MRNECSIIRDILPLYVENIVSEDTASFVEEHLEGCAGCRKELESVKASAEIEKKCGGISEIQRNEAEPLKKLKKKMRRRKILTILLSFLTAALLVGILLPAFLFIGFASDSEDIKLETEIHDNQFDRSFFIHIYQLQNKSLCAHTKDIYQRDGNGEFVYDEYGQKIRCGYEIMVRECPLENVNPNNYTVGYGYEKDTVPDEEFDFFIVVRFRDTTVVYSMREEGLFEYQDDLTGRQ